MDYQPPTSISINLTASLSGSCFLSLFLKHPYKRFCIFIFFIFTSRDLSLSLSHWTYVFQQLMQNVRWLREWIRWLKNISLCSDPYHKTSGLLAGCSSVVTNRVLSRLGLARKRRFFYSCKGLMSIKILISYTYSYT